MLELVKRSACLINCARGKLCDRDAIVRALKTGKLAGYAGDVWFPSMGAHLPGPVRTLID